MKIQISFDLQDLNETIEIASKVKDYCDIMEVGSVLIHKYGIQAVKEFVKNFPDKDIMTDTKIVDRGKEITELYSKSGTKWISVMAGTSNTVIHRVCSEAQKNDILVMLDTLDSTTPGQAALDAKNLGVDAILFHNAHDFMSHGFPLHNHVGVETKKRGTLETNASLENSKPLESSIAIEKNKSLLFFDELDIIKENTTLPIFISAHINRENIGKIISAKPYGIIIGKSITEAKDPAAEAEFYYNLCKASK